MESVRRKNKWEEKKGSRCYNSWNQKLKNLILKNKVKGSPLSVHIFPPCSRLYPQSGVKLLGTALIAQALK